jgi:hypothetical protein
MCSKMELVDMRDGLKESSKTRVYVLDSSMRERGGGNARFLRQWPIASGRWKLKINCNSTKRPSKSGDREEKQILPGAPQICNRVNGNKEIGKQHSAVRAQR